ncbi:MAG: TonB-dependent receptor, partial [Sphingobacteriales bacterium]
LQDNSGTSGLFGRTREGAEMLNQTSSQFGSDLMSYSGGTDLLWRHQFAKKGRTLSVGGGASINGSDGESNLLAENNFFTGNAQSDSVSQESTLNRKGYGLNGNIFYTEPISEKGQINLTYNTSYTSTDSDKRTYSFTDSVYSGLNPLLSNTFVNTYFTQSVGTGYRYGGEKSSFMISARYQHAQLNNEQEFPATLQIKRTFQDVLPMAMFRHAFSKTENLRMFYRAGTNPPSAEQLQNVLNNSNPVVLSIGNPDLKQNYSHNLNLRYSKTTTEKSRTMMGILGGNYTQKYVANQTFIADRDTVILGNISLPRGAQLTRPVNLDGQMNLRSFVSYGLPVSIGEAKSINVNTSLSADFGRTPGLINEQLNYANTQNYSLGLVFSSNISQNLDFTLSSTSTQVYNKNTLRPQLNSEYFRQSFRLNFNYIFYKGFFVQTDVNHQIYSGLAAGFDQNFTIWNARLGRKFFEDQRMELSVSVFDILGENDFLRGQSICEILQNTLK